MTKYAPQTTDAHAPAWARTGSQLCGAIASLKDQLNAHYPNRDHTSDGFLGDDRHVAEAEGSDHNPFLFGLVRAGDFDVDGINAPWLAEQLRLAGAAGDQRLADGGYVIYAGHITTPRWDAWTPYVGDPHTSHVHVSAARNRACDVTGPWDFLAAAVPAGQPTDPGPIRPAVTPPAAPPAAAAPTAAVDWTSPHAADQDARTEPFAASGRDAGPRGSSDPRFRASIGDQGPAVAHLQTELNRVFPAYSKLATDGVYWTKTAAVVAEFGYRVAADPITPAEDVENLRDSDGADFGPRAARAAGRYGLNL